jgi:molecular chaperone DnaK
MRREAENNAEADKRRKELIEVKNQADNTVYTAEKMLREYADKVPGDVKNKIQDGINRLRQTMNGENVEQIRSETEQLGRELQNIGASMYQQAGGPEGGPQAGGPTGDGGSEGGQQGGPQGPQGPQGPEDVVDGEFRNA